MGLNKQISHPIQSRQPGKTMQNTTAKWKIHRRPTVKWKGIQTNRDKTIIILIFTWKQNKHTQITQFARQKDRGCLRQLYEAIIPIWWKQLSWTCNNPAEHQNHGHHHKEDDPPEQNQKTKPSSIQQQPTETRVQRNRNRKNNKYKEQNLNRDSPHDDWSLHNNLPREFRNVVPEMPTQNMTAQPQSIEPLVSPHRSHSCNIKTQSWTQPQTRN
jgi:hypothetical protein